MAKKYLVGIKENALKALRDQGMLVDPIDIVMNENIMPWMVSKMMRFLDDEDYIDLNVGEVVVDGYKLAK